MPLCRIMIFPARHLWPPYNFTPSILGSDPPRFCVDPPCFLDALQHQGQSCPKRLVSNCCLPDTIKASFSAAFLSHVLPKRRINPRTTAFDEGQKYLYCCLHLHNRALRTANSLLYSQSPSKAEDTKEKPDLYLSSIARWLPFSTRHARIDVASF